MKKIKSKIRKLTSTLILFLFVLHSCGLTTILPLKYLPKPVKEILNKTGPKHTNAEYAYTATSAVVDQGKEISDVSYTATADSSTPGASGGGHWRILTTGTGIDATVTFNDVNLNGANVIYVNYDGSVSNAGLTYQIQIRDFTDGVWRNVIPHETTRANTTESASGLLTQVTAAVSNGNQLPVYDGYFSDGSNSKITTEVGHFVNGSNQVQIRFYSDVATANYELRVDYLSVEPAIDYMRYASGMTIASNGGTVTSGEYNDTTTDDASGITLNAGSSGVDTYFSFTDLPSSYSNANSILVEFSGNKNSSLANYNVYIYDFTTPEYDRLSSTNLTSNSDGTYHFATDISQFNRYISGNEIRIRLYSSDSSGTLTIDYLRVTIGSVTTNSGYYVGTKTRGGAETNDASATQTLDTSPTAVAVPWSIATSTIDTSSTTQFNGDCGTATNSCVAANIQIPVDIPANTMVTGVHVAWNYMISSASIDLEFGIRDKRVGNVPLTSAAADNTSLVMMYRTAAYPMPPQVGADPAATIPIYQPQQYINTIDDAVNFYVRTAATSIATAQTLTLDFVFVSFSYLGPEKSMTEAWTPTGATLTYGTNSNSNYRYTITDDNAFWVVTADGTNGTDVYLSFTNITIPTDANKLIIYAPLRFSGATTAFTMYLYDFISGGGTWRNIVPHASNFTGTAATEEMIQLEIFNGYFSDGSNNSIDVPLSYFVSSSELRLRITSASTSSNLSWDYAMVEFVKDPIYFPNSMSIGTGSLQAGTEYNDVFTDDATTNLRVNYSGGLQFNLIYANVLTPPTNSNAVYLALSSLRTTVTGYTVSLRNYGGGSCIAGYEAFNGTALSNTSDALNYFIKSISDWSCYISGGQMEIRFTISGGASGNVQVDFIKLALGTVNTDGAGNNLQLGGTYYNTIAQTRTLDTSVTTFDSNIDTWRIRSYPNTMTARAYDAPSSFAATIDFPITLPSNASPVSIIWMWKGANSGNTAIVPNPGFAEMKNYFSDVANSKLTLTTVNGLPDSTAATPAGDTTTLNTSTQTVREGWYNINYTSTAAHTAMGSVPNAFNTETNELRFRFRTSGSTSFTAAYFDLDAVFIALRYVD